MPNAMALLYSTPSELGSVAPPFSLPGVDGKTYSLDSFKDQKALLIVFMCNHCPYVIAVQDRINDLAKQFGPKGVAVVGISSNDPNYKEADSFENMKRHSVQNDFVFPYLFDETQNVAKEYDAVCTPDPYLYERVNAASETAPVFKLRYRGRIDDSWKDPAQVKEQSLKNAIEKILKGQEVPREQIPSMGCSIKWKDQTPKK